MEATDHAQRLAAFQASLKQVSGVAFLPISADLQYLTGIPREMPTFGAVRYPGRWLEGAWIAGEGVPLVVLPRMTATFHGLNDLPHEVEILDDADDPFALLDRIGRRLQVEERDHFFLGNAVRGETVVGLVEHFGPLQFGDASALVSRLRRRKTEAEIDIMRQAGRITEAAFQDVIGQLRFGMTELDIVTEIDYQLRRHGAQAPSFTSAMYNSGPEHRLLFGQQEQRWQRPLEPPVALLFDFGAVYEGYCYDFGRTVSFGAPAPELEQFHQLVMASQATGVAALRAGQTAAAVDAVAREVIAAAGYGDAFRHRLGHGIGLDVHEPPYLTAADDTELENGMLFTVEPSIMQWDSFSARVEDVVVVRSSGGEMLTSGFQKLIVVE